MTEEIQYLSPEKFASLQAELKDLKQNKIPTLAKRIDEARQMGDLSENAEYHAAREEMAWVQSRIKELEYIFSNAELLPTGGKKGIVTLNTTIVVKVNGIERQYTIVGAQEAEPIKGKISNESPLGQAFMDKKAGDKVQVTVPAGVQIFEIISLS
ncbi:MAG: transcription elongation factor GreA [Candidatus Magasanikbacteria bacterium]|nr:transcription elongation factor GreA [Candidatus Magasanikbacteria bacterium]